MIVKTLEVTIPFPSHQGSIGVPQPYESFAKLIIHLRGEAFPTQSVAIITFNYDIAADMALYQAGLGPNYVIEQAPQSRDSVALLKLHGSLNWATERDTKRIRPLHLHNYLQKYRVEGFEEHQTVSVPIGSHLVEYFSKYASTVVDPEPVIVPPSWNKADYHQALSDVWAAAAANLSEAEYVFIIGYSLPETDSFFRHLYALGSVGKAALRRIIVFNPDNSGLTDARFRALLGPGAMARYEYQSMTFEQSIVPIKKLFPKR